MYPFSDNPLVFQHGRQVELMGYTVCKIGVYHVDNIQAGRRRRVIGAQNWFSVLLHCGQYLVYGGVGMSLFDDGPGAGYVRRGHRSTLFGSRAAAGNRSCNRRARRKQIQKICPIGKGCHAILIVRRPDADGRGDAGRRTERIPVAVVPGGNTSDVRAVFAVAPGSAVPGRLVHAIIGRAGSGGSGRLIRA